MGYIRAREGRYQANVRRKGYATVTKTFTSREAAKSWSKTTEIQMERGEFNPHSNITVDELIKRYAKEVVPNFSGNNPALYRCNTLRRLLGKYRVAELTPATLASYRDKSSSRVRSVRSFQFRLRSSNRSTLCASLYMDETALRLCKFLWRIISATYSSWPLMCLIPAWTGPLVEVDSGELYLRQFFRTSATFSI